MSDLVINVKQISNYPAVSASNGTESLLLQPGGLGGPYQSISASTLVATALQAGAAPLGVGVTPPADALGSQVFAGNLIIGNNANLAFNAYIGAGAWRAWGAGPTGFMTFDTVSDGGFEFLAGTAPGAGQPLAWSTVFGVDVAGNASLPLGTLTVARDPSGAMDVATLNWVSNNTVASFNARRGQVTLTSADIYGALCLDSPIASQNYVQAAITNSLQNLLTTCPFVNRWNGRTGSVYLTLSDITCVFFQPGQQPISPTPPLTSDDNSIATTAWVTEYIANEFAGSGGNLATQSWVLANTVNSFNGRRGIVTLTTADVIDVGAAPLNSPNFSGIPTAPTASVGQATGQIATTAFVQQAISANTAGVSTFNTRSGDVVLTNADIVNAGGLANPSAGLTGNPTAPTQPPGTNLPVIATCEFVQQAISAGTVQSFNTRTGAVTLQLSDITGVGGAPIVSPAFSSVPTAPTAAPGTNTVQLATCAFVTAALATAGGVSSFNGRTGAVDLIGNDISAAGGLVNPSVNLTGTPTAPTAPANTNSQQIATTAFVTTALSSGTVTSFNTRTGAITLTGADITGAGGAVLASPAFTGVPTAPTAAANTNNTQLATTQFVMSAILADTTGVTSFNTRTGAVSLTTADITGAGGATSASPQFTGTPQAPTATAGTNTTQLATCAFVQSAIASSGVSSFNSRTGAVTLIANDISAAGGALLASPTFTGVPAGPTAAPGTNTTQLASTAYVLAAIRQPATVAPLMDGTAAVGTSLLYARQDHVHPTDTSRAAQSSLANYLPLVGGTTSGATTLAGTSGAVTLTAKGSTFDTRGNMGVSMTPPANATNTPDSTFGGWGFGWGYTATNFGCVYYDGTNFRTMVAGYGSSITCDPVSGGVRMMVNLGATLAAGAIIPAASWAQGFNIDHTGDCTIGNNTYPVSDPLRVVVASGYQARATFAVTNAATWTIGTLASGVFAIGTGTATPLSIDGFGNLMLTGSQGAAGGVFLNGYSGIRYQNIPNVAGGGNAIAFMWQTPNAGVVNVSVDSGAVIQGLQPVSDARAKTNIAPSTLDCLGVVNQLALKQFDWLDLSDLTQPLSDAKVAADGFEPVGLIAQEVYERFPSGVQTGDTTTDKLGAVWNLKANSMLALLVGAMQQMGRSHTVLCERIEAVEARLAEQGA